jgi:two-component system LytT family response regulator
VTIRALIAEDEPLARRHLKELLADVTWLECVGEAADGRAAVELIDSAEPDLVFLDIEMPELSGLQVLERITHRPAVIFTTAYDRYAVSAFELEALDYILKPFGRERLHTALERVPRTVRCRGSSSATADGSFRSPRPRSSGSRRRMTTWRCT